MMSKQIKKQKRQQFYNDIKLAEKHFKNCNDHTTFEMDLTFFKHLKQCNFKETLKYHKKLKSREDGMLESLLENPTGFALKYEFPHSIKGESEIVRLLSDFLKSKREFRDRVILRAMVLDSTIGYWRLSR